MRNLPHHMVATINTRRRSPTMLLGMPQPLQLVITREDKRRIEILCRTATKTRAPGMMGVHHVLELYDCPADLLNDASLISAAMEQAAAISRTKLLNQLVHRFPEQGVTALALLAESHIAIHTWPELGYAAVDLFACGEQAQPWAGCIYLIEQMQARRYSLRTMWRGQACGPQNLDSSVAPEPSREREPVDEGDVANEAACRIVDG